MKKRMLFFIVFTMLLIPITHSVAGESLFVQPFKAKIFAQPSVASEVIGTVDSGFQFASISKEGRWIKFAFRDRQGYLPAVQIAGTPPLGKSLAQNAGTGSKLNVRARTSSSNAVVAGVKGLTYEDRARITKGERSNFEALEKVDAMIISPDVINSFQLAGGKQ
jgi:hypothetical protein